MSVFGFPFGFPFKRGSIFPPFKSDLLTWHKKVDDDIFNEKINTPPFNAIFIPSIGIVDDTSQLQFTDLTSVSIVSSAGTSIPSINGNNIEFTVGECSDLLLDDGTFIPDIYSGYDSNANNDATVVNITKDYSKDGSLHKQNIGYSLYQKDSESDIQVPYLLTGTPKIAPTVPAGYTKTIDLESGGVSWNMADALVDFAREEFSEAVNTINDGDTVGWYDYRDLNTITKDGSNNISQWNDRLGSGLNLIQSTPSNQPLWTDSGVLFDGISQFLKTGGTTFTQPEMIYIVFKQPTWSNNGIIIDGDSANKGLLIQQGISPELRVYAGATSTGDTHLNTDTYGIARILFNGSNSSFQINNEIAITGDFGSNNMGGLTLGSRGDGLSNWSNVEIKEIIVRKTADDISTQKIIYDYLKTKLTELNIIPRVDNPVITFNQLGEGYEEVVADPFIIYENGKYYLYAEIVPLVGNKEVGLFTSNNGLNYLFDSVVIDNAPNAYPFVFKDGNEYYMYLSLGTNIFNLLKSANFPYEWNVIETDTFTAGKTYADGTIYKHNSVYYLFVQNFTDSRLELWYSNTLEGSSWVQHPSSPLSTSDTSFRMAGRIVNLNDTLYCPRQDSSDFYGKAVKMFVIDELTTTTYSEHEIVGNPILTATNIWGDWNYKGMHHIDLGVLESDNKNIIPVDGQRTAGKWATGIYQLDPTSIFNRSDVNIQTSLSRSSLYYDSGINYTYHVDEISSYETLQSFFEAAHKDKVFAKVKFDGPDIALLIEVLNYGTQKIDQDRFRVMKYCNIIEPVQTSELEPVRTSSGDDLWVLK